jgi:penicillin-insensitive murein DD-endopeptidase
MGSPTEGHLVDGVRLDEGPAIRIAPVYASGDVRYGTRHLVHLVDRASRQVRHKFPDAVLSVGHLSRRGGGELDRHASHESGRDADLGFYVASAAGKPLYAPAFVPFSGDGKAKAWPGAHFDDAKNWALVEALLTDPEAHVTHIFVAQPLRERLLAYAQRMGVRDTVRVRASETMAQPKGALPHDDHFHVRIACPKNAEGCVENPARRVAHAGKGRGHDRTHGRDAHASKGVAAHKPAGHASQPARPAHETAKTKPAVPAPPASKHEETSKKTSDDHADVPHLGPFVPGLDSVVIPAPMDDVDGT